MKKIPARYLTESNRWVCNLYALSEEDLYEGGFTDFDYSVNPEEEYHLIGAMLDSSTQFGMSVEVVQFALKYIKENPRLTPAMAMRMGYEEWIK